MRAWKSLILLMALAGPAAAALETATVVREPVAEERVMDAVVEAVNQATVAARTAGRVVEVLFDVDDYVPAGALIVRLDDTAHRAGLEAAQAQLAEARARVREAETEFGRVERLHRRGLVARAELDRARAALDAARARVMAAEAQVAAAEEALERTRIRAPYAGIVTRRMVEVGESVQPGTPLMAGLSLERLRVTAAVPQSLAERVRAGAAVRVRLPDGRTLAIPRERVTVFPYADPVTHTVRVRLALDPGVKDLYPGMLVKAAFTLGRVPRLLIPAQALVRRSEVQAVYVVDEAGGIHLRLVRVGRRLDDGRLEVLAGLAEGERVALDPIRAGIALKERAAEGRR
ncbi:efflux RND transporter periplasmic adaptor subunit [Inmirania thermothiophila]|uniref:RND family efflux transporter MFP subunit n=1 Tax=Inmirania thermothiophila TaxID=1750597 RepID=A0A3N1XT52_9GAMM|nr:efflux RND transporter periplasmic adaptor subunit [Inmirania thermothiophila]ROR29813.1 RND family efflux transporter MFP subunit [Inmirania thermothiophila]